MSARRWSALLLLNAVPQALLGVGLFALSPETVFPGIDATGALCLRLAAFSNVPQVILVAYALLRRVDLAFQRVMVLAFASYHLLAFAQAALLAFVLPPSALGEACRGPAVFHGLFFLVLAIGGRPRPGERVAP